MYQCEHCGSQTLEHICPGPDVKGDVEEKSDRPEIDPRAAHMQQHDETEAEWRLRRILEMNEEGLTNVDIGKQIGIGEQSVRSILQKQRQRDLDKPLQSSLAMSLTNHTPDDANLERIKQVRHAADALCELIDRVTRDCPETDQAKVHLEETVMWAVKALVLPQREGEGGKIFSREQREELGIRGEERY